MNKNPGVPEKFAAARKRADGTSAVTQVVGVRLTVPELKELDARRRVGENRSDALRRLLLLRTEAG